MKILLMFYIKNNDATIARVNKTTIWSEKANSSKGGGAKSQVFHGNMMTAGLPAVRIVPDGRTYDWVTSFET